LFSVNRFVEVIEAEALWKEVDKPKSREEAP
jgi:hypothetical protein